GPEQHGFRTRVLHSEPGPRLHRIVSIGSFSRLSQVFFYFAHDMPHASSSSQCDSRGLCFSRPICLHVSTGVDSFREQVLRCTHSSSGLLRVNFPVRYSFMEGESLSALGW
ncbi:unnamed protein product, partial [Ectocarpus sp. 12 AP-2014]